MLIWDPYERLLNALFIFLSFFTSLKYISASIKKEDRTEKHLLMAFSCLFIGLGLSNTVFFIKEFYYLGTYDIPGYYGVLDESYSPVREMILVGHFITFSCWTLFAFLFERAIPKSRYLLTTTFLVFTILNMLFFDIFFYPTTILSIFIITLIIIWLVKHSTPEFQNIGLFYMLAMTAFTSGMFFNTSEFRNFGMLHHSIVSIFWIIGTIFFLTPMYAKPESVSRMKPLYFWIIIIMANTFWLSVGIYLLLFPITPLYMAIGCFALTFPVSFLLFYIFKRNRRFVIEAPISKDSIEGKSDMLSIFSKPKKLTEEEVSVAKEKGVCLVCKNEITRQNYVCPSCKSLYCIKCSSTLAGMENACWVCNTPFDETKPVKKEESKEEYKIEDALEHKGEKKSHQTQ